MRIPLRVCLVHSEEGPWQHSAQWSMWLSLQYIQASQADSFWRAYRAEFLEAIDIGELPYATPEGQPPRLNANPELVRRNRQQLKQAWGEHSEGSPLPELLVGTNALVLSRAYDLDSQSAESVAAFVPFLDLLNHSSVPNVTVRVCPAEPRHTDTGTMGSETNMSDRSQGEAAVVVTSSEVIRGEVLSSYADGAPEPVLCVRYGIVPS